MKNPRREEPKIVAAAEKQMRHWTLAQQLADRTIRLDQGQRPSSELGDYATVSREAGVGGEEIAQRIGRKLGWEVLDKELLDLVADRYQVSRSMLELVDETESNWAFDILGAWMDPTIISREKYLMHLMRIVLAAAKHGNVLFVGRGVHFLLPPGQGLAVRIVAPEEYRIERIARLEKVDAAKARQIMLDRDRGRQAFVQQFFNKDVADPHLYDIVLNVGRLGEDRVIELIVEAWRNRKPG